MNKKVDDYSIADAINEAEESWKKSFVSRKIKAEVSEQLEKKWKKAYSQSFIDTNVRDYIERKIRDICVDVMKGFNISLTDKDEDESE